MSQDFFSV